VRVYCIAIQIFCKLCWLGCSLDLDLAYKVSNILLLLTAYMNFYARPILLTIIHAFDAGGREDVIALLKQPRQRKLTDRTFLIICEHLQLCDYVLVNSAMHFMEPRHKYGRMSLPPRRL
jgi:hypothetical protein